MGVHKVVVERNWSSVFMLKTVTLRRRCYRKRSDPWVQEASLEVWRDATPDMVHLIYCSEFEIVLM